MKTDKWLKYYNKDNKTLDFSWADSDDIPTPADIPEFCEFLDKHPEITALSASFMASTFTNWDEIISTLIKALVTNKTITSLNVAGNYLGDQGAIALASLLETNKTITTLYAYGNHIGPAGAVALAANTTLRELELTENQIGIEGARAFAKNNTLESLTLSNCSLGAEEAKAIAQNQHLKELVVTCNKIGDEGAKAFLMNQSLLSLDIADKNISDETHKQLKGVLEQNKVSRQAARALFVNQVTAIAQGDKQTQCTLFKFKELPRDIRLHIFSLFGEGTGATQKELASKGELVFSNIKNLKR